MVLVLTDPGHAASFRRRIPAATVVTDAEGLAGTEGCFDAAVLEGRLEQEPWDRWVLQRVHRLLRMDAPIEVVVPRLASPGSALDAAFLAYACRQVALRAARLLDPHFELPGAVHRRYFLRRLARKMESVGYTAIEPAAGAGWLASRCSLTARKTSSLPGVHGRAWPGAEEARERNAGRQARTRQARERWLHALPELAAASPRALEPAEWRDARVVVLSPHPDDELIGCGGTLRRVIGAGAEVTVVQATDGSRLDSLRDLPPAARRSARLEEAKRVAAALGAAIVLWRGPDGELACSDSAVARLARLLGRVRATHVFTPFLGDLHRDHVVVSRILAGALAECGVTPQVLQYEVWGLVPANLYCDITAQMEELERLLLLYDRAMRVEDFVHFCTQRGLAHAWTLMGRAGYAEAFLAATSAEFGAMAARTTAL